MPGSTSVTRASALALLSVVACSNVTGADERYVDGVRYERRPSVLAYANGDAPKISAPDTVQAGVPFSVTVTTYGGGCIVPGETATIRSGSTVEVRPFEWFVAPGQSVGCTLELRFLPHTVSVTLPARGTARLRVIGRQQPEGAMVSVDRVIVVR